MLVSDTDLLRHSLLDGDRHFIRLKHIPTGIVVEFEGKLPKDRKKEATVRAENRKKALELLEKKLNAAVSI